MPIKRFERNFLYFYLMWLYKTCRNLPNPSVCTDKYPGGVPTIPTVFNNGGTRSGKTWEIIAFIYTFCDHNRGNLHKIGVYRDTMVNCRDITLGDFLDCFNYIGLERDIDYIVVKAPRPIITIGKCTIEFMGIPELGKEGGKMSICYINELIENNDRQIVMNLFQRTTHFCLADWNPSVTDHWCFNEKGFNVYYTNTTYLDNSYLQDSLKAKYESWCPWDFADSHIEIYGSIEVDGKKYGGFKRRVWDKPECPDDKEWNDSYRRPNNYNIDNGTANKRQWLIYGEGIPCGHDGSIFNVDTWLDEFPDIAYEDCNYGLDFGYTSDYSCLTKVGRNGRDLNIKYECYQQTREPHILYSLIKPILEEEESKRRLANGWKFENGEWIEGYSYPDIIIACDSKDNNESYHFVSDLNMLASNDGKDWYFLKCKKPRINTRIGICQKFHLHVVKGVGKLKGIPESEFSNYIFKVIEGRATNIPIDKFNHGHDSWGYKVWTFDRHIVEES
jgi:phage terminase large subunit